MSILDKIVIDKRKEVEMKKSVIPTFVLESFPFFERETTSLKQALQNSKMGIIAEFKRKSPSKSNINLNADVTEVVLGYEMAGASGVSILTDEQYFGGTTDELKLARKNCSLPILRKDFIIDAYQIYEAKAIGADVILLIAAILTPKQIKDFTKIAHSLNLEVLLEIHNKAELQTALKTKVDLIGVNNRNLKTFEVSVETSKTLAPLIPEEFVKISESGISSSAAIKTLQALGYQGFLMGEHFMKTKNPADSAKVFIEGLV